MSAFTARAPFEEGHPKALAVYCSDGRFTNAVEELLHHLGHARLDTLTLPGGPGLFNYWTGSLLEADQVERAARFLIRGHGIEHVVLLAHAGCGYYRQRHAGEAPAAIRAAQIEDLRVAARRLASARPGLHVTMWWAAPQGERIRFDEIAKTG